MQAKFVNILAEYDQGIWSESKVQEAIMSLPQHERNLLILYADMGSYAKMGERLGCSGASIYKRLKPIREKLQNMLSK